MEKEENKGKENILNSPNDEFNLDIGNDDIEVIPQWGAAISEEISVTYGPPLILNEDNHVITFQEIDDEPIVFVDSDMYGGPLPENFYLEEIDLYDSGDEFVPLCDDIIDSDDESKDRKSNYWDDVDEHYV